jgi:hypothetical protein
MLHNGCNLKWGLSPIFYTFLNQKEASLDVYFFYSYHIWNVSIWKSPDPCEYSLTQCIYTTRTPASFEQLQIHSSTKEFLIDFITDSGYSFPNAFYTNYTLGVGETSDTDLTDWTAYTCKFQEWTSYLREVASNSIYPELCLPLGGMLSQIRAHHSHFSRRGP